MLLGGIHHVTAVSAKIAQNAHFYTHILGLRLVKKSVNQDDVSAYHLFYADKIGSPGTDMTFFDWAHIPTERRGTDSITTTAFRVNGAAALAYWVQRLDQFKVPHQGIESADGYSLLRFADPEGQRLMLVDDQGADYDGEVWDGSEVPTEHALRGFYAVLLSVPQLRYIEPILTQVLGFSQARQVTFPDGQNVMVYNIGASGAGQEVWVMEEPQQAPAQPGAGGVHHVAFRVADDAAQSAWHQHIQQIGLPVSGIIDRFYFKSIYFRISNGILFEIATDGPGFAADEDPAHLGERLALPPFLEPRRAQIEAGLKPINMPTP